MVIRMLSTDFTGMGLMNQTKIAASKKISKDFIFSNKPSKSHLL